MKFNRKGQNKIVTNSKEYRILLRDQAVLGSRIGNMLYCFQKFIYMYANVKTRRLSKVHDWCYITLINMLCKPNIVGDHKCLVSNSVDIMFEYKTNLKPVICLYDFRLILFDHVIYAAYASFL